MQVVRMLGGLALVSGALALARADVPVFTRDVAPIIYARCAPCHQPDGDAPFALVTYDDVRRRARLIADATAKRYMPPWKPEVDSPAFVGERRLRDEEIATIDRWVNAGAPEGRAEDLPAAPRATDGWISGEPDLVLALPRYSLRADGADVFRNFVITVPGHGTRYVRGVQFRPRNRAVHHANIRIDATPASRALDAADPAAGYEGVVLHSAEYPEGHFLGWTPGQASPPSNALAWRLTAGSDLVVQLHLRPTGRVEEIAPVIGVYFTDQPPARTPAIVRLGRQNIDIAPGSADYTVSDSFVLPVAAEIVAIQPHAHYRARDVAAWAVLPNGSRRSLIHIADWDFSWQDQYRLAAPMALPAGTTLAMKYSFDNSDGNPRNPSRPSERVSWGWRTSDEMGDVWIQMLTRDEADRRVLAAAARRKMTEEDAIGAEVLIAREPSYVNLRNDAGLIYRELGRPDRALEHFAAVTRLEPQSPAAHYNQGVTLDTLGREAEAAAHYAEAIRLDPGYALAHNALGNMSYRAHRLEDAIAQYRAALAADASLVATRCNLAHALTETGRAAEASAAYRLALTQSPDDVACLINVAWLLSAHRDAAIRRPAEAVQFAERAVALTGRESAAALDALAAAYASAGRFDAAVQTGTAAVGRVDATADAALAADIRARIDLYRRRLAFVVPEH